MTSLRKALIFGFLAWLIPFLTSVCLYRIRQSDRPLFESIMPVVLAVCAAVLLHLYFRNTERRFVFESAILGALWLAMSILFDLPMFLFGPMKMPLGAYMSDIGAAYLMIPAVCIPSGFLLQARLRREA